MSEVEKKIEQVIFESVKSVFEIDAPEGSITVETPKDKKMGDYASSVAMRLAKVLHKSPMQIAEALITSLQEGLKEEVKAIEVANPGFINFRLSEDHSKEPCAVSCIQLGAGLADFPLCDKKRLFYFCRFTVNHRVQFR